MDVTMDFDPDDLANIILQRDYRRRRRGPSPCGAKPTVKLQN
jgi:hypothetical protein